MKRQMYLTYAFAALVTIGGLVGFARAASSASLVTGFLFGSALALSAYAISKKQRMGLYNAFILSLLLAFFFAYRLLVTQALMPAGLMLVLSVITAAILLPRQNSIKR